jgi:hypothetical protein
MPDSRQTPSRRGPSHWGQSSARAFGDATNSAQIPATRRVHDRFHSKLDLLSFIAYL